MFENCVVEEGDSLCREFIRKGFIDEAIELQLKLSEMRDLAGRKYPVNRALCQAHISGDFKYVKELFKQREDFMREYYTSNILPCF